ncbi:DNA methyltransferase [Gaetbulibacter sp. PBL-D1]|uniref:DNA methyltransferase n=1 Tax=Gaetbulibacter sp. PBL-D1 TaxID=3422594 RepID=UPI003D2EF0F7
MNYQTFIENKIIIAENYGFDINISLLNDVLLPHQKDIVKWCLQGGRRAVFASFGLGKTIMQLEIARQVIFKTNKPFLIGLPLGVIGEFKKDIKLLDEDEHIQYITDTDSIDSLVPMIYLTNYERIRKGDIDASKFGGVSFDEASVLRNLKTETTNYVLEHFGKVPYRFVFTATPSPNNYLEILNYAQFLGVIDRGHALTQFFKRDPKKAGNLKLNETQREEFWKWVSSWAVFINKPSDLGYDDTGYDLPKMHIHEVEVENLTNEPILNKDGDLVMFKDVTKSLVDTSREKSESIELRVNKAFEIIENEFPYSNVILWHHREAERVAIEKRCCSQVVLKSVYGSQTNDLKEKLLIDYSEGRYQILSTKPKIAGSGCNFQHHCSRAIFVGIDYKFNDFIQAVHRIYRFKQNEEVHIYIIHTQNEREVLKTLKSKWKRHIELQTEMINLVRNYGLNNNKLSSDMKRQVFKDERHHSIGNAKVWNQDCTIAMDYIEENSTGLIVTSIPFGNHYEYSSNYNDYGHNPTNEKFFEQMDYLVPKLYKSLMPGRIAAIHVKDRIRYSYQNGTSFSTIDDFSGETVRCMKKHGFHLIGKITVPTDVVQENNQTYRLTWGELVKDSTKMGCGLPEYILLFRKPPSDDNNAYADLPVSKTKEEYSLARWQLDAHAIWQSNGNRFLTLDQAEAFSPKTIYAWWKEYCRVIPYDYQLHIEASETLDKAGKLSKKMMSLMNRPNGPDVMNDISRLKTLNANQKNRKKEKHICPLQLDIIERLIFQYSNPGEIVGDPFGGLFSTSYMALKMQRKSWSMELNPDYYDDGLFYLKSIEYQLSVPTLFDMAETEKELV